MIYFQKVHTISPINFDNLKFLVMINFNLPFSCVVIPVSGLVDLQHFRGFFCRTFAFPLILSKKRAKIQTLKLDHSNNEKISFFLK